MGFALLYVVMLALVSACPPAPEKPTVLPEPISRVQPELVAYPAATGESSLTTAAQVVEPITHAPVPTGIASPSVVRAEGRTDGHTLRSQRTPANCRTAVRA